MMKLTEKQKQKLARKLVLNEHFDLALYERLVLFSSPGLKEILNDLIPVERRHAAFWETFFEIRYEGLDWPRKIKLSLIVFLARIFGDSAVHFALEAIEVHGIRNYLIVWQEYKGTALGGAVRDILEDEFGHEDRIVSGRRVIDPDIVRNILFGFNDGLVEILGAVSGFFAAFQNASSVFLAGITVAVAGAISMGASAFAAISSESEVQKIEAGKKQFLGKIKMEEVIAPSRPSRAAFLVGISYFAAALFPLLPVLFGAKSVLTSLIIGGIISIIISVLLSFISGMETSRRVMLNLLIIVFAVSLSYAAGFIAKEFLGFSSL